MKKRILIIFAFAMVISLFLVSCAEKNDGAFADVSFEEKTESESCESTESESLRANEAEETEKIGAAKCSVDFLKEETEVYDESGVLLLLSGQLVYPTVSVPENLQAEELINAYFEEEKTKYYEEAEKMRLDSVELLGNIETDYWNTFIYDKKYSLEFLGDKLISFICHTDIYLGGVHPTPDEHGVIFDIESGKCLSLTDLFTSAEALQAVAAPKIKEMIIERGMEPFDGFGSDVSAIIDEGTFVITDGGVKFICNVYVLFPYVSGINYYTVNFDELGDVYLYSDRESYGFLRFYSFDMEGELDGSVLGFVDTREFSCPYVEDDACIINGEDRHVYYIVPAVEGCDIVINHVLYDEAGNEIGSEIFKSFKNTEKDFCLKITCPMLESRALYRVCIQKGESSASFDLIYTVSADKPIKLIK